MLDYFRRKRHGADFRIDGLPDNEFSCYGVNEGVPRWISLEVDEFAPHQLNWSVDGDFRCDEMFHFTLIFNDTPKFKVLHALSLDKYQEMALFRMRLSVSGLIPNMEAMYCCGVLRNNSFLY